MCGKWIAGFDLQGGFCFPPPGVHIAEVVFCVSLHRLYRLSSMMVTQCLSNLQFTRMYLLKSTLQFPNSNLLAVSFLFSKLCTATL